MASRARMDWRGEQLIDKVRAAARLAVNETVDLARDDARETHDPEWVNRPTRWSKAGGQLESEIGSEHAHVGQPNPTGRFGFGQRRGFYGLFHEVGTAREFEKPVLRPAADRIFPTLAGRIRRRLVR